VVSIADDRIVFLYFYVVATHGSYSLYKSFTYYICMLCPVKCYTSDICTIWFMATAEIPGLGIDYIST